MNIVVATLTYNTLVLLEIEYPSSCLTLDQRIRQAWMATT